MGEKVAIKVILDKQLHRNFVEAIREEGWDNINDAVASAMRIYLHDVNFYERKAGAGKVEKARVPVV